MRGSFRERLALYLTVGMFVFSGLFVLLWVLAPEFSATGGTLAGVILGTFATVFVTVTGGDVAQRALAARETPKKEGEE